MRINKKATLQLSINAIVIIVLAMTILGLGLGFVRGQFKQIGSTGSQVQEQIKEQILEQMRTGGKKVAVQKQINLGRRESAVVGIGIKNVEEGPVDLEMNIAFKQKKGGGEDEIEFFYDPGPFSLGPTEEKVLSAEASSGSSSGTYIYEVVYIYADGDAMGEVYDKASFFVKVQWGVKMKKRLTQREEFEIMKLVLDKFLWFGFAIMAFGLYKSLSSDLMDGIWYMLAGGIVLILFMVIIVKEYEIIKWIRKDYN